MIRMPKVLKPWRDIIKDYNPEALFIGGKGEQFYDGAITGIGRVHGSAYVLVYSYPLIVECLAAHYWSQRKKNHMTVDGCYEAAIEWTDFNTVDAYVGPHTPFISYVDRNSNE